MCEEIIEYRIEMNGPRNNHIWETIASVGRGDCSHTRKIPDEGQYQFRMKAVGKSGLVSPYSRVWTIYGPPSAPDLQEPVYRTIS